MEFSEISEKQITKRQHYVPKAYLKNFAAKDQDVPRVYAVFPNNKESKLVSIEDICFRAYLYDQIAIDPDSGARIFAEANKLEDSFIEYEGNYATIISKLKRNLDNTNKWTLLPEEIEQLKQFVSILVFRNPVFVHMLNCMIDRLYANDPKSMDRIKKQFPDTPSNILMALLANEFLKMQISPDTGMLPRAMLKTMDEAQVCIFKTQDSFFITSDMPVVNIHGKKDGIAYDLLGMPITPSLFLAFVDTKLRIPQVVQIDECNTKRINGKQIRKHEGVLISNKEELLSLLEVSYDDEDKDDTRFFQMLHADKETVLKRYNEIMNAKEIKVWR